MFEDVESIAVNIMIKKPNLKVPDCVTEDLADMVDQIDDMNTRYNYTINISSSTTKSKAPCTLIPPLPLCICLGGGTWGHKSGPWLFSLIAMEYEGPLQETWPAVRECPSTSRAYLEPKQQREFVWLFFSIWFGLVFILFV